MHKKKNKFTYQEKFFRPYCESLSLRKKKFRRIFNVLRGKINLIIFEIQEFDDAKLGILFSKGVRLRIGQVT